MNADGILKALLLRVRIRQRRLQLWATLACCWAGAALLSLLVLVLERQTGWASWLATPLLVIAAILASLTHFIHRSRSQPDWRQLAQQIEMRFPDLDGRLLTAVQQTAPNGGELNYLQQRVLEETLASSHQNDWADITPKSRLVLVQAAHWMALILFLLAVLNLPKPVNHQLLAKIADLSVTVTPGDTSVERGNSLVVLARFGKALPPGVDLVVNHTTGAGRRIPLAKSLADPVFGGSIPEVVTNLVYHLEYGGQRTRDYTITVFEYPRLERADADITFPDYTRQRPKRIENTHRLSAVEGSHLDLALELNKPVSSAQLIAKDKEHSIIPLKTEKNRASAVLKEFPLVTSKSYDLLLVDAEGRTNRAPTLFVFDALTNRAPEMKLTSPRGDLRPTAVEEVSFEGTIWDDFGVEVYGLGYTIPGQETRFVELGRKVAAKEKAAFQYALRLEDLGLQPDQLVAWFAWADDLGPDGKVRRTSGDLFFAEVRAFDEIFREGMQADGGGGGGGGGPGGESARLLELQKQIISATWNLKRQYSTPISPKSIKLPEGKLKEPTQPDSAKPRQSSFFYPTTKLAGMLLNDGAEKTLQFGMVDRRTSKYFVQLQSPNSGQAAQSSDSARQRVGNRRPRPQVQSGKSSTYPEDVAVIYDAMAKALEQVEAAAEGQRDPRSAALATAAVVEMKKALELLAKAKESPKPLPEVITAEQAAYQALLKLREHEYEVVRNGKNQSQGGGSGSERMQKQLEQMEMTQSENRYETQRQAQRPQNNQAREQLQVMNRLQELARRQQDLNERLKELQTALQEARTEQEREEIRRRLKRLQEEEQQVLADVDEVRQRMDRPENQSNMAEQRRQLEQTREDVQRAAQASSQGSASQALAAGTRAQQQLQELRDQMRKGSSNQFSEDLRQMRADARELSRQQEDIMKKLDPDTPSTKGPKPLSDAPEREQLMNQLAQQKERLTNLVERATEVSQEAEIAEPLLSRQLYDTLRKFSQDNLKNMRQTQEELLNRGLMTERGAEHLKQSPEPDANKLLDITSEMVRQDSRRQASETAQRSRGSMDEFKKGVERAAESVLGDDTEALRLAQDELNKLVRQLEREMSQAGASSNQLARGNQPAASRRGTGTNQLAGAEGTNDKQPSPGEQPSATPQGPDEQQSNQQAKGSGESQSPSDKQNNSANEPGSQGSSNTSGNDGKGNKPGSSNSGSTRSPQTARSTGNNRGPGGNGGYGNDWGGAWLNNFNRANDDLTWQGGPLTGGDFGPWSDRLREIEEVLEFPDLRHEVATARERARLLRQDFKRDQKKPDWAIVRLQVMKPLLEVRDRVADELARRESNDALVPIDRDPVPTRYSDLVRRYYEELGKNKTSATK